MDQGREHERRAVSLMPRYRVATELDYTESACLDLSTGGMFIASRTPAKPGTLVKLECEVGGARFRGLGKVAWCRESEAGDDPPGMGIRFLKLEDDGPAAIERALSQAPPLPPPGQRAAATAMGGSAWLTALAILAMAAGAAIILLSSS